MLHTASFQVALSDLAAYISDEALLPKFIVTLSAVGGPPLKPCFTCFSEAVVASSRKSQDGLGLAGFCTVVRRHLASTAIGGGQFEGIPQMGSAAVNCGLPLSYSYLPRNFAAAQSDEVSGEAGQAP